MLNRSKFIAAAICIAFALPASANDNWLEEQRSISDGYSTPNAYAGPEGRKGVDSATANVPSLDARLFMSDGDSPLANVDEIVYVGASFEVGKSDFERTRRITDGSIE
jgi:hypothetical protein